MTLDQLNYVIKVAQMQSMSQAAEQIFITQQPLSQAIAHLERELGMQLFERKSSGVQLTAYGERFVEQAQVVLAEFTALADFSQSLSQSEATAQQMTIFSTPVVNKWLLPEPLSELAQRFPQCTVTLMEYSDTEQLLAQAAKQPCVAVVSVIEEYFTQTLQARYEQDLHWEILLREPLQVCAAVHSPWAEQKEITLAQFFEQPLAASEAGEYVPLQKIAEIDEGVLPTYCTYNRSLLSRTVKEGAAVALYPSVLRYVDEAKLRQQEKDYVLLPLAEGLHEITLFIWPKDTLLSPAAQMLWRKLAAMLKGDGLGV